MTYYLSSYPEGSHLRENSDNDDDDEFNANETDIDEDNEHVCNFYLNRILSHLVFLSNIYC